MNEKELIEALIDFLNENEKAFKISIADLEKIRTRLNNIKRTKENDEK